MTETPALKPCPASDADLAKKLLHEIESSYILTPDQRDLMHEAAARLLAPDPSLAPVSEEGNADDSSLTVADPTSAPSASYGWETMESAPSDGRKVWVWGGYVLEPEVREADGEWWRRYPGASKPTHWHPYSPPIPPTDGATASTAKVREPSSSQAALKGGGRDGGLPSAPSLEQAVELFADAADYNLTCWDAYGDGPTPAATTRLYEIGQEARALLKPREPSLKSPPSGGEG